TGAVNDCLGPITIQTQNASNTPTNVTSNTTVNLATDGSGGFFSDNACASSVGTSVGITTGNNAATFYYKPTARGTGAHLITPSASGLTSASQTETENKTNQTGVTITVPASTRL